MQFLRWCLLLTATLVWAAPSAEVPRSLSVRSPNGDQIDSHKESSDPRKRRTPKEKLRPGPVPQGDDEPQDVDRCAIILYNYWLYTQEGTASTTEDRLSRQRLETMKKLQWQLVSSQCTRRYSTADRPVRVSVPPVVYPDGIPATWRDEAPMEDQPQRVRKMPLPAGRTWVLDRRPKSSAIAGDQDDTLPDQKSGTRHALYTSDLRETRPGLVQVAVQRGRDLKDNLLRAMKAAESRPVWGFSPSRFVPPRASLLIN